MHASGVGAVQSVIIGAETDKIIRSTGQCIVVVIISKADSDPETSDNEVVLDGEDDDEEREESG